MKLQPGTLLANRYRVIETIERGGMSWVYRVVDEHLGIAAVLKENMLNTKESINQFRLEAIILATLRHRNLPRVTDLFMDENGCQYLVMDYLQGESLRTHLEKTGNMSDADVLKLGVILCGVLRFLHSRRIPIFHRDIKPGNIQITPDGQIFLLDFGIAKLQNQISTTDFGARAMTPGYSPPEQYRSGLADARSDIYSLAATLYEALTGIKPEDGLERALRNVTLSPIRKRNPKISRYVAAVIEKGLEIDPDSRYQAIREFEDALIHAQNMLEEENLILYFAKNNAEVDENIESSNSIARLYPDNRKYQSTLVKSNYREREKGELLGPAIPGGRPIAVQRLSAPILLTLLGAFIDGWLKSGAKTLAWILSFRTASVINVVLTVATEISHQPKEGNSKKPRKSMSFKVENVLQSAGNGHAICDSFTTYTNFQFKYSEWVTTEDVQPCQHSLAKSVCHPLSVFWSSHTLWK